MDEIRQTVESALANHRGDDLHRAESAFRNATSEQMAKEYGNSGQTPQEILDGYRAHESKVDRALQWVKEQIW